VTTARPHRAEAAELGRDVVMLLGRGEGGEREQDRRRQRGHDQREGGGRAATAGLGRDRGGRQRHLGAVDDTGERVLDIREAIEDAVRVQGRTACASITRVQPNVRGSPSRAESLSSGSTAPGDEERHARV